MPQFPWTGLGRDLSRGCGRDRPRDGATGARLAVGSGGSSSWAWIFSRAQAGLALSRRAVIGGGFALTLAGCNSSSLLAPGVRAAPRADGRGRRSGRRWGAGRSGSGMILPLTQNGAPSAIGVSMRNAAQLAIDEFSGPAITLMIQDDRSTPGRRGAGGAGRDRRGRAAHSRTGLRQRRASRGVGRQGGREADDRLLDRRQRRLARSLPAFVPGRSPMSTGSPNSPPRAARSRSR